MKKIILFLVSVALVVPSMAFAFDWFGLQAAYDRLDKGTATETDLKNIAYMQKEQVVGGAGDPFQPSGIDISIRESLVAGSARTGTTLDIDPIVTEDDHRVTFSDFNSSVMYAKINQGNSNEEIFKFTGMTDNTTYYTLTGVTWGCNFYDTTCDVDANKKRHLAGDSFKITTDFHFINENFLSIGTAQTLTGIKTFDVYPVASSTLGNATTSLQFITLGQANSIGSQGAATSTETTAGISELATRAESAAGTSFGVDDPHVQQSQHATSTPGTGIAEEWDVWSESDGKLNQSWLDLTEAFTFDGVATFNASSTSFSILPTLPYQPSNDNEAARKDYVDSVASGIILSKLTKATDSVGAGATEIVNSVYGTGDFSVLAGQTGRIILNLETSNEAPGVATEKKFRLGNGTATTTLATLSETANNQTNLGCTIDVVFRTTSSFPYQMHCIDVGSSGETSTSTIGIGAIDISNGFNVDIEITQNTGSGAMSVESEYLYVELLKNLE